MKIFIYFLLTTAIILISRLRFKVGNKLGWYIRKDREVHNRIYFDIKEGFFLECCDCGLTHKLKQQDGYIDCIPERPLKYGYTRRFGD